MLGNEVVKRKPKLIFLWISKSRFTERDFDRFGVSYFWQKGYVCEIWSIHTKDVPEYEYTSKMFAGELLYEFDRRQYKQQVKKNRGSIFFICDVPEAKDICVLAKNKCKYILYSNLGPVCWVPLQGKPFKRKWLDIYYENGLLKTCFMGGKTALCNLHRKQKKYINKLITPKIYQPLFVVSAVKENDRLYPAYLKGCKKLCIHSMDYDRYVEEERKDSVYKERYILWIDSGWGFIGGQFVIKSYLSQDNLDMYNNRERHFKGLRYLFEKLEEHYQMPVIIAGHPHTMYDRDMYDNREFYLGKTAELVKNAEFVMMNISTSLSLTLLWNKRILMVCDDVFAKTMTWREWGGPTCELLGLEPFNWDNQEMREEPWKYLKMVEPARRKAYLDAYVDSNIPQTKSRLIVEIVEEEIQKLCNESEIL